MKNTRPYVILIFAQVSGIIVTLIVKILVLLVLRRFFYAAFYRKRPGAANIMTTILECWNVGLSTLYMIIRSIILLVITAVFVARVSTNLKRNLFVVEENTHLGFHPPVVNARSIRHSLPLGWE